jgi:anti-sigma B factor antagonist
MQLILRSETKDEVVVVQCRGRIVTGEEAQHLQHEVERLTDLTKDVVLDLREVTYIDSGGIGAVVRMLGAMRAARGDLKLCNLPPFVTKVLQATNLLTVFHPYESEKAAIGAFAGPAEAAHEKFDASNSRVICIDSSPDVLAYLKLLLREAGYQVFTTQVPSDAVALLMGTKGSVVICGPGMRKNEAGLQKLRQSTARMIQLAEDFSTSEADRAGTELLSQVRAFLADQK